MTSRAHQIEPVVGVVDLERDTTMLVGGIDAARAHPERCIRLWRIEQRGRLRGDPCLGYRGAQ